MLGSDVVRPGIRSKTGTICLPGLFLPRARKVGVLDPTIVHIAPPISPLSLCYRSCPPLREKIGTSNNVVFLRPYCIVAIARISRSRCGPAPRRASNMRVGSVVWRASSPNRVSIGDSPSGHLLRIGAAQ